MSRIVLSSRRSALGVARSRTGYEHGRTEYDRPLDWGPAARSRPAAPSSTTKMAKESAANCESTLAVPAPDDAEMLPVSRLAAREALGRQPEDLVFMAPDGGMFNKMTIGRAWKAATGWPIRVRDTVDRGERANDPIARLTWYQATRHSFVSRNLSSGASLDEVGAAVGHSSPLVTRRCHDHVVRKSFSEGLRAGLGLGGDGRSTPVVSLATARKQRRSDPGAEKTAETIAPPPVDPSHR